jgi:hypothetical protein
VIESLSTTRNEPALQGIYLLGLKKKKRIIPGVEEILPLEKTYQQLPETKNLEKAVGIRRINLFGHLLSTAPLSLYLSTSRRDMTKRE